MRRHLTLWLPSVAVAALLLCGQLAGAAGAAPGSAAHTAGKPRRLLLLSLPGVTWNDLSPTTAPTLTRLLSQSAVADLVTRADRQPASLGAAYVTIGSGTRSATTSTDGDAVGTDERIGDTTGAAAYRQRTGRDAGHGIVQLGIPQIISANAALLFDARVGALGDRLRGARFSSAVIANADQPQPVTSGTGGGVIERPAVSALMDSNGILRNGRVSPALLTADPYAPYGAHLDADAVTAAFRNAWQPRTVVMVEGSDLARADQFGAYATPSHAAMLRRRALRDTDAIVARLLESVDLRRDAVMVVAPTSRSGDRSLTVFGLRTPKTRPGLLQSATTRRAGFVALSDIAPTILDTLGVSAPSSMEGRPVRMVTTHGSPTDRRTFLIRSNEDGLQRDALVAPVTKFVAWASIVLALGTLLLLDRVAWAGRVLQFGALWMIGFVLATFVVVPFHVAQQGGDSAFWTFTILFALLFAAICLLVCTRNPVDPLIAALAVTVLVLVIDNLTHDRLEFNAVFGYSATVGIRLSGNGNSAFSVLGASAVVAAGLVAWRIRPPRGIAVSIATLAIVLVAFTPPLFGQDFGGTLAAAPAFFVLAWLLLGRKIRFRTCLAFAAALVVSGLVVGFLDLLRPHDQRTHVGRFFEQVGHQGWSGLATVLQRKGTENAATLNQSLSLLVIVTVVAIIAVMWFRTPSRLRRLTHAIPTLRPIAISLAVLAVLGYALNDSGLAIPALMCETVVVTLAFLTPLAKPCDPDDPSPDPSGPELWTDTAAVASKP